MISLCHGDFNDYEYDYVPSEALGTYKRIVQDLRRLGGRVTDCMIPSSLVLIFLHFISLNWQSNTQLLVPYYANAKPLTK